LTLDFPKEKKFYKGFVFDEVLKVLEELIRINALTKTISFEIYKNQR
tara:strand:- start:52 stop:192 length:141 start_codon:yes stop_codon:yes gene_type:complete